MMSTCIFQGRSCIGKHGETRVDADLGPSRSVSGVERGCVRGELR